MAVSVTEGALQGGTYPRPLMEQQDSHHRHWGHKPPSAANKRITGAKSTLRKSCSCSDYAQAVKRWGTGRGLALSSREGD